MEKGFNDDELADIMNEIESLEKEFSDEVQNVAADPVMEAEEEVVAEPQREEVVAEPQHEEVVAEPQHEEVVAEPQHEEVVAEPQHEEVVAGPQHEEVVAGPQHEEVVAGPQHVTEQEVETVAQVTELPVDEVVEKHEPQDDENVHHFKKAANKVAPASFGHSSMSFNVEGNMKLDLAFNISGKNVSLNITEEGFELTLDNGMKFSIPLDHEDSNKKAA